MKRIITLVVAGAAILMLAQCARKTSAHRQSAEEEVAAYKAKYPASEMVKGQAIYQTQCIKCHQLKKPADFSVRQWNKILPKMAAKAGLNSTDAELVKAWIITNTKAG